MHFVALIKGMPLKIRPITAPYQGDQWAGGPVATHNEASVDSELSALPFLTRQISGAIPNPYFQSFRGIGDYDGPRLLLVCRLDAPTFAIVRRMIVDAIAAEKSGLWGRGYVDGSSKVDKGFEIGDKWMAEIVQQLHKTGIPVVYDDLPAVFPDGYPITDCSLYYGWYAGGVTGPFARPDFRFLPGAVAVHIHSFSAEYVARSECKLGRASARAWSGGDNGKRLRTVSSAHVAPRRIQRSFAARFHLRRKRLHVASRHFLDVDHRRGSALPAFCLMATDRSAERFIEDRR